MQKVVSVPSDSWIVESTAMSESFLSRMLGLSMSNLPSSPLAGLMQAPPNEDPLPTANELQQLTDLSEAVEKALLELPEDYRDVLVMIYGEGMSLRQVEHFTGIPKTTVSRRRDAVTGMFAKLLLKEMPQLADRYEINTDL
jgi:RNA polymerase sigma factor (sigma-70 family)|tara:strand:+ start:3211 stop:3633 length:423 start_codon:yes stop_codon:yes gene_type:complete